MNNEIPDPNQVSQSHVKLLIISPLRPEKAVLTRYLARQGVRLAEDRIGRLPVTLLPDYNAALACGGGGKAQFALQTQHLIDACPGCDLVICAGAAGSLAPGLRPGDVVVATRTVEHDFLSSNIKRLRPSFPASADVLKSLRCTAAGLEGVTVHFGKISSGDETVMSGSRKAELHRLTGGLAVAWEGAGGARACKFSRVRYVEVRGITDSANGAAVLDFLKNLKPAMQNVGTLILAWLEAEKGMPGI